MPEPAPALERTPAGAPSPPPRPPLVGWLGVVFASVLVLALIVGAVCTPRGQRGEYLQYLFFCRYPLLLAFALLLLPAVATLSGASTLLKNLFSLSPSGIFAVTLAALHGAWAVMITAGIVLAVGPARFGVEAPHPPAWLTDHSQWIFALLALPLIATAFALSPSPMRGTGIRALFDAEAGEPKHARHGTLLAAWIKLTAVVLGVAVAFLLLGAMLRLTDVLSGERSPLNRFLEFSYQDVRTTAGSVAVDPASPARPKASLLRLSGLGVLRLHGYLDKDDHFALEHLQSASFLLITLVVYLVGYFLGRFRQLPLPAITSLLLILLLLGLILPGMSFFLDRYRVPVLVLLVVFSLVAQRLLGSDHYFPIRPAILAARDAAPKVDPAHAFLAGETWTALEETPRTVRRDEHEQPVVVVCASGGGITAALWTAKVLAALQRDLGRDFSSSIRLLSAVSGGSVGALFFLDRFTPEDGPPLDDDLDSILEAAGKSSLNFAAWGLAYPDLWRALFGTHFERNRLVGRGWALEQAWQRKGLLVHRERSLLDWQRGIGEGWLPAAILNGTVVQNGNQFLLTGLDDLEHAGAMSFIETYAGYDTPAVTAARLSASFPWVTPLARPASEDGRRPTEKGFHIGDGGYFDNFGVVTAMHWMRRLLPETTRSPQEQRVRREIERRGVALVLIRAFPRSENLDGVPPRTRLGWLYEPVGPLVTLLNVRGATQTTNNSELIRLVTDVGRALGVRIEEYVFELAAESPLSWKLTDDERRLILDGWDCPGPQAALAKLRRAWGR